VRYHPAAHPPRLQSVQYFVAPKFDGSATRSDNDPARLRFTDVDDMYATMWLTSAGVILHRRQDLVLKEWGAECTNRSSLMQLERAREDCAAQNGAHLPTL
jgi:hypothetical protein